MKHINGFITAPFTPMNEDLSINLDAIDDYMALLSKNGLDGVFICGSSGEGAQLTREERMSVAEKWIEVAPEGFKVIVHVGGVNVEEMRILGTHASQIGAYAIATMSPLFLRPGNEEGLAEYCAEVASSAPELPFYFYQIPALAGGNYNMTKFLKVASSLIPNLAGVKFTTDNLYDFMQAMKVEDGKFELLHGLDETFLHGLISGAKGGVGGTYNHIFPIYKQILEAYKKGDLEKARELQLVSQDFINILVDYRGNIVAGKRMMKFLGVDCGPNRLPLQTITDKEEVEIKNRLDAINFSTFCN